MKDTMNVFMNVFIWKKREMGAYMEIGGEKWAHKWCFERRMTIN